MKIDSNILIRQYWDEVKDNYPDMDFEEFKAVCKRPFEYTKEQMESGELPTIRLKYFGTFLVYPKRARSALATVINMNKYKKIAKSEFERISTMLNKYLENE